LLKEKKLRWQCAELKGRRRDSDPGNGDPSFWTGAELTGRPDENWVRRRVLEPGRPINRRPVVLADYVAFGIVVVREVRARRRARISPYRSRQRHNAGCPAFEVLILYPFHPRAGQMVQVEHRKRFAGEDHLVVVQPDGTLNLIPAWMSEDNARSATLTASPAVGCRKARRFAARRRIFRRRGEALSSD
jgi:hypothetical protein